MAVMAKKPQADEEPENATTPSTAPDTLTLKRGPFTLTAKRIHGDGDEASHFEVEVTKEDTSVKPGQLAPELEHLDVHFEVGANLGLARPLADKIFDWFRESDGA